MSIEKKFDLTPDVESFIADYRAVHESVAGVELGANEIGERFGVISDELVASLERTQRLFISEETAQKRLTEAEERITRVVEKILAGIEGEATDKYEKKAASLIKIEVSSRYFDSYVGSDAASITVSVSGVGEADDLVDDSDIEHEALYYRGAFDGMSDSFESWDWLAWLADERSPFYDSDFVDAYALDQASQALEQHSQTLNESTFESDVKRDLETRIRDLASELQA